MPCGETKHSKKQEARTPTRAAASLRERWKSASRSSRVTDCAAIVAARLRFSGAWYTMPRMPWRKEFLPAVLRRDLRLERV